MHPVSKYMTFNYRRSVCFVVSAQLPEVLEDKETRIKEAESSQRKISALLPSVSVSITA